MILSGTIQKFRAWVLWNTGIIRQIRNTAGILAGKRVLNWFIKLYHQIKTIEKKTTRIKTFSDGVFAIAQTLMVPGIKVTDPDNFSSLFNIRTNK
jgi:hypothetical protein